MDLVVFENNKALVLDEFRAGRFDYVELASDVAETKFFQFLFGAGIVDKLAQDFPTPRERELVPRWMYLSSQLSLRLHGQHGYHSFPLIIRAGGLVEALGPDVARRDADPQSGNVTLQCTGFNDRNHYPRQTPCDQDYLRKLARDTEPQKLEDWYNRHVVKLYQELGAFDSEGLFIGDGTYLFVPDNPRYEGSHRLLFDEHNHPVSKKQEQEMTKSQRSRCRWRRFYKAVLLLHVDAAGERFVVAGLRVVRDNEAEATAFWPLVDTFLATVGAGVMKVLLLDRGFINGPLIGRLKREHDADGHETSWLLVTTNAHWSARRVRDLYGMRPDIEERHRQVKCFWDLSRFHSTAWSLVVNQTVFVCLTYSLLQLHLLRQGFEELNRRTRQTTQRLLPDGDRVVIYRQQYFAFFTLMEHMELTLSLDEKARRKALAKTRRLRQNDPATAPGPEDS